MSPFKPSNRLPYQGPISAIPSLEGNASDRSSALERKFPDIPNNKRLSGAHQDNPKRPRRGLPESTKANEKRVGLADGPGIATDRNSLIESAPREAWEDEFMQYPEDNLVPQKNLLANQVNFENLSGAPNQDSDFFNLFGVLDFGNASASFESPDAEMGLASSSEETSNTSSGEASLDDLLFGLVSFGPSENFLSYLDSNNLLKNQNPEINFEKELEANHTAPSAFGSQGLEENTELKEKNKDRRSRVGWTDELRGIANAIINDDSNQSLDGKELHKLFEKACRSHSSGLKIPGYESFRRSFLGKTYKPPVRWTDELKGIANAVIDNNSNQDLSGMQLYRLFEESCKSHDSELKIPGYESFNKKCLDKSFVRVNWTDELEGIASAVIDNDSNQDLNGIQLYRLFEESCKSHNSELKIPGYEGFNGKFLDKSFVRVSWTDELEGIANAVLTNYSNKNLYGVDLYRLFKKSCESHDSELKIPSYESFRKCFL